VGGSTGCIEILDGRWNEFLEEIETLGQGTCEQIAAQHHLKVFIQPAPYPTAVLAT
jgi:adenosine/AMP kinase